MMKIAGMVRICLPLLLLAGCEKPPEAQPQTAAKADSNQSESSPAKPSRPAADWTANEILQQLLATYRGAKTYEDQAIVRLSFRRSGTPESQKLPAAVAFERPSRLSIRAFQATVKCDGKELRARIDDPIEKTNLDGQVLIRPIRQELKLADLAADKLLYDILISRLQRQPIQLELLLESGGLVSAFGGDVACERLADAAHDGRNCFRVAVPSPGGAFTFWVDQADCLLRRLDYPAAALLPDLASDPTVSEIALLADLRDAKINRPIPAAQFTLDIPPNAKRMKTFVVPPQPLPSDLFGQQPRKFFFTRLDGAKLSDNDLAERIEVLVWYHDDPACEATLQQVSLAAQRLQGDAAAAFYAVATDPTTSNSEALTRRLANWKVELPIVRDLEAFGDTSFHIQVQPTIVVLDKRGLVQVFQAGGNEQLADQLVTIVERLKRGDDLAAEIVTQHAREQSQYEQLLARGGPEPDEVLDVPEAVIRRRSEPKKLRLQPLWTCTELKAPGNILLVESPSQPTRVLAVEGWRMITEVGPDGNVIARHALELPEQAAVTFLRTATDQSGKRYFVASAPLAPQLFVFDEAWRLLLAYPPRDQAPLQVVDLALIDVGDVDGTPEILVASAGDVGLVAVSLTGEVKWRNRAFPNALAVVVSRPDDLGSSSLLVAGELGSILRVNRFGHEDPPLAVANWPILRLFSGRFSGGQAAYLGLSNNAKRELFVVGLTDKLKESWNYPLPAGVHQRPIEPVASSQILLGHEGEWWLSGPDGSVHTITEDGQLFDSFYYGSTINGLAAGKLGERAVLLVATDSGLTAWEVLPAPASKRAREF
jgi:hypothetical protein